MLIIPAIDLLEGKVVRLRKGNFSSYKVYSDNPFMIVQNWKDQGAKRIHIIDLKGAKEGKITQWEILEKLVKIENIQYQFGGGIRNNEDLKRLFAIGIDYAILSSRALTDRSWLESILKSYPSKIILSIDILAGKVKIKGWEESLDIDFQKLVADLGRLAVKEIIVTDISRDGTLLGVDIRFLQEIVKISKEYKLDLIYSGGISSQDDLNLINSFGIEKVIVGKALYQGKIKL